MGPANTPFPLLQSMTCVELPYRGVPDEGEGRGRIRPIAKCVLCEIGLLNRD